MGHEAEPVLESPLWNPHSDAASPCVPRSSCVFGFWEQLFACFELLSALGPNRADQE